MEGLRYAVAMTPAPAGEPQAKYALPTVAFILSLVGLCICPTALVGSILGIVAWVRISKEPHLPGKGLAIAATFIPLALVPVIGIQAAIAIPNFIRYQARAKQGECRANLRAIWTAERSFQVEKDHWSGSFEEIGFRPEGGNRYSYFLSPNEVVLADTTRFPDLRPQEHAAALARRGIVTGVSEDGFTAACVGNVDNDEVLDVWTLSSRDRTDENGAPIPAGTPFNDVNDLTTP